MQRVTGDEEDSASFERYKYIPLRLTEDERRMLTVLESALEVSEYTDAVDVVFSHSRKNRYTRIIESLVDFLSITSGLMVAGNLVKGESLVKGKELSENVPFFRDLFEIARRYKIMNPTRMRDTYGKLMFILMDTRSGPVYSELKINFIKPILTVHSLLLERGALTLLSDPLLPLATGGTIFRSDNHDEGGMTSVSSAQKMSKVDAASALIDKYRSAELAAGEIQRILESIADNNAYLVFNVQPVDRMIALLKTYFDRSKEDPRFSLELTTAPKKKSSTFDGYFSSFSSYVYSGYSSGFNGSGSCLTHSHSTQYSFVLQSLTLWSEIMANMPRLWTLAELDMFEEPYRLADTGQGYNRMHSCPNVGGLMRRILSSVQRRVGEAWVGLSVVHLGDRDVPNALVFIDKYSQVPRILAPISQCVETLPGLSADAAFHAYVANEWGSIDGLRMQILSDFFKHGFDGSGDDGGSCIDGRLTSAWNWCSKLEKKPYYHVFMFTGFQGFDGDWK